MNVWNIIIYNSTVNPFWSTSCLLTSLPDSPQTTWSWWRGRWRPWRCRLSACRRGLKRSLTTNGRTWSRTRCRAGRTHPRYASDEGATSTDPERTTITNICSGTWSLHILTTDPEHTTTPSGTLTEGQWWRGRWPKSRLMNEWITPV